MGKRTKFYGNFYTLFVDQSNDEFLVKKKSPLVMPPEFYELPIPGNDNQEQKKDENSDIISLITGSENETSKSQNSSNQNTNFENLILKEKYISGNKNMLVSYTHISFLN